MEDDEESATPDPAEGGAPEIVTVAKPDALLALHSVTAELFETLRRWFGVPPTVPIDLREVDSAVAELGDPVMIAALAMRKLQALHLLATPGVMTTTDVVVTIVQDLDRALVQAPNMRLKLQAASTDWDAAFAELDDDADVTAAEGEGDAPPAAAPAPVVGHSHPSRRPEPGVPSDPTQADPETDRFRVLHSRLHEAVFAVLELSEGEIRYLI